MPLSTTYLSTAVEAVAAATVAEAVVADTTITMVVAEVAATKRGCSKEIMMANRMGMNALHTYSPFLYAV